MKVCARIPAQFVLRIAVGDHRAIGEPCPRAAIAKGAAAARGIVVIGIRVRVVVRRVVVRVSRIHGSGMV